MSRLVALHAGGASEPWQQLGLTFSDSACRLADVQLTVGFPGSGLVGWTIETGRDESLMIDGIPTTLVSSSAEMSPSSVIGQQSIVGLDHVVVNTDDLDRTCSAIENALSLEVRRERQVGNGVVQRFHKLENTIIEVVTGPHITSPGASLWGMVISVDDLFDLAEELGENVTSMPKKATQPGRYISTVRSGVGLGIPFAMMTPHISPI